ncbi:hypothetical protein AB7M49_006984 [Bradyrhizobium elkanii]
MTVASETNLSGPYNGNGVTTVFDYEFRIVDEAHLAVIKTAADGTQSTLTLNSDYTVSGVGASGGGQITMAVAPATGTTITIVRDVPFTQETDLENQGPYFAETIEAALDLSVMRDQQIAEEVTRAWKSPFGQPGRSMVGEFDEGDLIAIGPGNTMVPGPTTEELATAAREWAIDPENQPVSQSAGGDGTQYSALHWSYKAKAWATFPKNSPLGATAGGNGVSDFSALHWASGSKEWANNPQGTPVSPNAGGNGVDEFSARHWAAVLAAVTAIVQNNLAVETFAGDGARVTWTLAVSPASKNNCFVTIDGAPQLRTSYSLGGVGLRDLTFSEAPPNEAVIEVVYGNFVSIGTPADGTVGQSKLAFTLTNYMLTLLDDPDASSALTTLGVSAFIKTLLDDADAATARGTLGAAPVNSPTFTGSVTLPGDPGTALGAATKQYVDNIALNLGKRARVRVATTANITIATALVAGASLDGVVLAAGDQVLVKDQTAPAENGVYVAGAVPARAAEFDTYNEYPGSLLSVAEGTANVDTLWLCTSNAGGTLGTTAIAFAKMNFAGELLAGNNLADLPNKALSRASLQLSSGDNVQFLNTSVGDALDQVSGSANGQLRVLGNGYNFYARLGSDAAHLGVNSAFRKLFLEVNLKPIMAIGYGPVTKTANFTVADTENYITCNQAATTTVTLPLASDYPGRRISIKTIQAQTVVSASANVVPLVGGAAGTAILAAIAGKWAALVSDGTNWIFMEGN